MTAEIERHNPAVLGQHGEHAGHVRTPHVVRESMSHNESEVAFVRVVHAVKAYSVM
ncbi:hypothetical protein Lesp02_36310 [Lentzea sp. NBRC 105346]|nr:hypothetical protein Lesp02_36310 [Lentzea sp. NBRC 105346]